MRQSLLLGTVVAFTAAFTSAGLAQSQQAAAREAYNRGVAFHDHKEFAAAARQFALADRLVPSDSVLADAIDESVAADDAAFGSMLVARVTRRPRSAVLERAANKAREKFRGRAGRIDVRCPAACDAEVDGKALDPAAEGWLATGPHVLVLTTAEHAGYRDEHRVNVVPAEITLVTFQAPPPPAPVAAQNEKKLETTEPQPRVEEPSRHGLAPTWFWVGAGVTALVAGGAALSWVDASKTHQDFVDRQCGQHGSDDCVARADDGKAAVTRTNVLIGVASASAVATAVIGLFLVDWKPRADAPVRTSFSVEPGGARAVVSGSF
ncbi:hypothetical protein LZC95_32625 [Pendulispora brunnea]|uniref:PEGA domain-containing protein n=1 Tax=Pendulispora brunnea TaxID=2905690 RepID=A0ABZ2JZF5_9BACT